MAAAVNLAPELIILVWLHCTGPVFSLALPHYWPGLTTGPRLAILGSHLATLGTPCMAPPSPLVVHAVTGRSAQWPVRLQTEPFCGLISDPTPRLS